MRQKIVQKIRIILLILFFTFILIPSSFSQLLSPLETQPSDFGEAPSRSSDKNELALEQQNPEEKSFFWEANEIVAELKKEIEKNPAEIHKN